MLSLIFPLRQSLSVKALSLCLRLQAGRGAAYNSPFKASSSQPLSLRTVPKPPHVRSLCLRVRLGLGIGKAGGSTYRSPLRKPSFPAAGSVPVFCSAQRIAPTFSSTCTADVAFIRFILGSHKLFQGIAMHGKTAGSGAEKKTCKAGLLAML